MLSPETSQSPRKRQRLTYDATEPKFESSDAKTSRGTSDTAKDAHYKREVESGITEFIRPDSLGFSGILKKRYGESKTTLKFTC